MPAPRGRGGLHTPLGPRSAPSISSGQEAAVGDVLGLLGLSFTLDQHRRIKDMVTERLFLFI